MSTEDQIIKLLNQASLTDNAGKLQCLRNVQELLINKDPVLLDNMLLEIMQFHRDSSADVRKFVLGFIEEVCRKDMLLLPKCIDTIVTLLSDPNLQVERRVIQVITALYRDMLLWQVPQRKIPQDMTEAWVHLSHLKGFILEALDAENEGIRTHAIKFIEVLVLCQSLHPNPPEDGSEVCINLIPPDHVTLDSSSLKAEGGVAFQSLVNFTTTQTITPMNLMTSIGSLTNVAKQRPNYLGPVVQVFESLHANLPPTLSKSQVSSVRKQLKLHATNLFKIPSPFTARLAGLLSDLGATSSEIERIRPKITTESTKRLSDDGDLEKQKSKRKKVDEEDEEERPPPQLVEHDSDKLANVIAEKLTPEMATELVLIGLMELPSSIPPHFNSAYTPIAAAGTKTQIQHLARMLAAQISAQIGITVAVPEATVPQSEVKTKDPRLQSIEEEVHAKITEQMITKHFNLDPEDHSRSSTRKNIKPFNIDDVCKPLKTEELESSSRKSLRRLFQAERNAENDCAQTTAIRHKLIVGLVTQFGKDFRRAFISFALEDMRARADIIIAWLYREYVLEQGYVWRGLTPDSYGYEQCLQYVLHGLYRKLDPGDRLFTRILLECPEITEGAMTMIKSFCENADWQEVGISTLYELLLRRSNLRTQMLDVLLGLTMNTNEKIRDLAIERCKDLFGISGLAMPLEDFATTILTRLIAENPTHACSAEDTELPPGPYDKDSQWTEESIRSCLHLFLALLPLKPRMIHGLAEVYRESSSMIKRIILRMVETPVSMIGMKSKEILQLIESGPKGSETLVTRVLHILTENEAPSKELVTMVRGLYAKRVTDVRMLIPVLPGLDQKQLEDLLPKILKQTPNVVKEAFKRILSPYRAGGSGTGPITPAQLLIALHHIEGKGEDMKGVIAATNLCFAEKGIYTSEVLAIVLTQLLEVSPIPLLYMRSVIQAISMWPRMISFVLNILGKLVSKQIWKQAQVWRGFVKCCAMLGSQAHGLLLTLPASRLKEAFQLHPALHNPLLQHVQNLPASQKALIDKEVLLLIKSPPPDATLTVQQPINIGQPLPPPPFTPRVQPSTPTLPTTPSTPTKPPTPSSLAPIVSQGGIIPPSAPQGGIMPPSAPPLLPPPGTPTVV
ncbi:symplekin-like [Bolinopsis microptera]|uniref:symplekin-like n=1 Tax=Bolinopsis microptera TaxID=2820187 RepID=UPI00307A2579